MMRRWIPLLCMVVLLASCSSERFLTDGELLLDHVHVHSDDKAVSTSSLEGFVRQRPNARWFSLVKVPLGIYCLSGRDSTWWVNRLFRRIGEAPVVYDSVSAEKSRKDIEAAVRNLGYLGATVDTHLHQHRYQLNVNYNIHPGSCYTIRRLTSSVADAALDSLLRASSSSSLLHEGMSFDVNVLDQERSRIATLFQNSGYYHFNKGFVRFDADTAVGDHGVDLTMRIPLYRASVQDTLQPHPCYHLGSVTYVIDVDETDRTAGEVSLDTLTVGHSRFVYESSLPLRPSFLVGKSAMRRGELYSESDVQATYENLSSLSAVLGANVAVEPSPTAADSLDATVNLHTARRHAFSAELEGTNSAGDLGAALALGYQNQNLFKRSAQLNVEVRGAFEAIKGLQGYTDQNFIEYSAEVGLKFPEFAFPFLTRAFRRAIKAQSTASVRFDSQDRPEFHRRVLTAAWRYRWSRYNRKRQHRIDLADLNYVFMPWISETFKKEYLMDNGSRNAVLRYNYENLFIVKWGYSFQYTSVPPTSAAGTYGRNAYSVRFGVESAGNFLYAISNLFNTQHSSSLDAYTLFNIAYAQYVKGDFDFSKSFRFDERNSLAFHIAVGAAFPYANSKVLPYEKRYFSGGANSVRGWSVRGLGPGSFSGSDGRVDFIHQTGDLRLDMSVEWRSHLFWKLDGALFVDAGNIWTFRDYAEQPGGQFRIDKFYKQIAVAYGLGFRFNFGYFILRLDGGMKAINPAYETGRLRYPIIHPVFGRDFQFHFAVGLPY